MCPGRASLPGLQDPASSNQHPERAPAGGWTRRPAEARPHPFPLAAAATRPGPFPEYSKNLGCKSAAKKLHARGAPRNQGLRQEGAPVGVQSPDSALLPALISRTLGRDTQAPSTTSPKSQRLGPAGRESGPPQPPQHKELTRGTATAAAGSEQEDEDQLGKPHASPTEGESQVRNSPLSGADVRGAGEGTPGAARPRPAPRSPPPPPRALGGGPPARRLGAAAPRSRPRG